MHKRGVARWTLAAFLAVVPGPFAFAAGPSSELALLNEHGVSLALAHDATRAESSFVSLLSQRRHDARALNNLGNLSLMKGEVAVALSFYDAALRSDSADAGVRLNRAASYHLMGEESEAVDEAAIAVRMAGGMEQAGALIGLREMAVDSSRASDASVHGMLTPTQMRTLLRKAAQSVPAGSPKARPAANIERGQGKRVPVWRSGSVRASEQSGDAKEVAALLYWKR